MPKVSIIIPVYNVEKYIKKCVNSVLSQTYKDFELILVDDGSPDNCGSICDEYKMSDGRIKVIHKENGGLVSACTAGIMEANCELICFVDSDDWISEDFLEVFVKKQQENKADVVCCQGIREYENQSVKFNLTNLKSGIYKAEDIKDKLINDGRIGSKAISNSRCGKLFKTSILKKNLNYYRQDIVNGEDQQLIVPILLDSQRILILSEFYSYHYRFNNESITGSYIVDLWEKYLALYDHIKTILNEKSDYTFKYQHYNELITFAMLSITNEYNQKNNFLKRYRLFKKINNNNDLMEALKYSCVKTPGIHKKLLFLLIKYRLTVLLTSVEYINHFRLKLKRRGAI